MRAQHLIQTRFSVKFPWGYQEFPRAWLEERLLLLDAYCLPSVKAQTETNFTWLVYCDEQTDGDIIAELGRRARELPQMKIMLTGDRRGFREVTDDVIDPSARVLITTRLDSDDAIHMRYVETIQDRLVDFAAMRTPRWLLNFPRGYQLDQVNGKVLLDWEPRSPFHSLFENDPISAKTVLMGNHSILHRQHPTTQDDSLAAWLMVIHGGNAENRLRGYYMGAVDRARLAEFGIRPKALAQSCIPMPIVDENAPIALRPIGDFKPRRASIFEDPGDEKSWHSSQRTENLTDYYKGREPSWYDAAIRPLQGADRVLDLGCGPGLALRALRSQGATRVLGVDRWPAFFDDTPPEIPVVAHDLTLPMPFIESGSFDGVLSHYALDYVSPIGMRQVLREAHRVLAAGGQLAIYVAAVGLGTGDDTRTSPYVPRVLERLLEEAGFAEIHVEATSNGRNSFSVARRARDSYVESPHSSDEVSTAVADETQLSAAFNEVTGDQVEIELTGDGRSALFRIALPARDAKSGTSMRVAVCARVVSLQLHGMELQAWVWNGTIPVAAERTRLEFLPALLRIRCAGRVEHEEAWSPGPVSVEPTGDAYVSAAELADGEDFEEAERGAEGRKLVVQPRSSSWSTVVDRRGRGRNRLLIRRAESGLQIADLDRDWLAGKLNGVVLESDDLIDSGQLEIQLWAARREALLLVEGPDWESLLVALADRIADLPSPVVIVDPALTGFSSGRVPQFALGELVAGYPQLHVTLGAKSRAELSVEALERLRPGLLHSGPAFDDRAAMEEANETLRYLTERTLLNRLRERYRRAPHDVGRRPNLA